MSIPLAFLASATLPVASSPAASSLGRSEDEGMAVPVARYP